MHYVHVLILQSVAPRFYKRLETDQQPEGLCTRRKYKSRPNPWGSLRVYRDKS